MKLVWIVENFTDSGDYRDLIVAVNQSGRECYFLDKSNNFQLNPSQFKDKPLILFLGSIQSGRFWRKELSGACRPIIFCTEDNFLCSKYYPRFLPFLFNDRHISTTVGDLKERKFEFYAKFGKEAIIFIRPDKGDKSFSGQLLDLQDFDRFWVNNLVCGADEDDIVYISTPKTIVGEYRFVVSKEKIIAQTTYFFQNQKTFIPSAPKQAADLVNKLLKVGYHPDPVYCYDICSDIDNNFWLLELTSFSSAGLYSCNKRLIVEEVSNLIEGANLTNG